MGFQIFITSSSQIFPKRTCFLKTWENVTLKKFGHSQVNAVLIHFETNLKTMSPASRSSSNAKKEKCYLVAPAHLGVSFYRILQSASWYFLSASTLQYSFSKWSKECLPRLRRRAAWWVSNTFTKYRPKSLCSHSTSESAPCRTLKSIKIWECYEEQFYSRLIVLCFHTHVSRTRFLFSVFYCKV